ncbi:ribonuclease P protein component [Marihabitans asiaticum]|uniref:Ribonuclease P protein component n=1 Tax=Marihabitans asiaticum TaxID=415218 RepID=A0A560WGI6_9MICO|nr:ribonuclease P protein component [Marihabitans asiaticum]TWD16584.1 ribonuclease P protein component [Marihabitans asiaticum]
MLPAQHRLTERREFTATVRGPGARRKGSRLLVVHARHTDARSGQPPRVGVVVSKAVGNAVTRNRVKRRLRAQIAPLLTSIPSGTDLVLRANPAAAQASSRDLGDTLGSLLTTLTTVDA